MQERCVLYFVDAFREVSPLSNPPEDISHGWLPIIGGKSAYGQALLDRSKKQRSLDDQLKAGLFHHKIFYETDVQSLSNLFQCNKL